MNSNFQKIIINSKPIELNEKFRQALDLMENTSRNIFITGKAGTGKSTLLECFRQMTKKAIVVLAPTGVAAVNIQGQTIHSFFRFKPDVTISTIKKVSGRRQKLYKKLEAIVIDEISMVRADLLDCVDRFLRLNSKNSGRPFGGLQMIFIGDLYQLPPVVIGKERQLFRLQYKSPYFFDAKVFQALDFEFIELEKIYRQKDEKFIDLLNKIRNNSVTDKDLKLLSLRCQPNFKSNPGDFYIYLTPTNDLAEDINRQHLKKLKTSVFLSHGNIDGQFSKEHLPTQIDLSLKVGAQIMLLNNDKAGRWVNGSVGKILTIEKRREIVVKLINGEVVNVTPYTWEIFHFYFNEKTKTIEPETVGSFTQYPIRLAWAITIHKSQGKTFDKVILDMGRGAFACGQTYVALSRCTGLDGVVLKKPISKKHIWMDWRIVKFLTKYQYQISEKNCSLGKKIEIIKKAIKNKSKLNIVYLKPNDDKSKRLIAPKFIGEMEYLGRSYLGLEAFCYKRGEDRVFRLDRILEIKPYR